MRTLELDSIETTVLESGDVDIEIDEKAELADGTKLNDTFIRGRVFKLNDSNFDGVSEIIGVKNMSDHPNLNIKDTTWVKYSVSRDKDYSKKEILRKILDNRDVYANFEVSLVADETSVSKLRNHIERIKKCSTSLVTCVSSVSIVVCFVSCI